MKKFTVILLIMIVLGATSLCNATLWDRGGGLIYDSDQNITWLQDAGMGGLKSWHDSVSWANDLVYRGYDDWRLPTINEPVTGGYSDEGEMGHLYYTELGNTANIFTNAGPFINLLPDVYWTSLSYPADPDFAYMFYFGWAGWQGGLLSMTLRFGNFMPGPYVMVMLLQSRNPPPCFSLALVLLDWQESNGNYEKIFIGFNSNGLLHFMELLRGGNL